MRFSQFAGTTIVPTLARLILGMAFMSLGWCKLTEWIEIPPEKAERLSELGVEVKSEVSNVPVSLNVGHDSVVFASLLQETEPENTEQKQQEQPPEEQPEETPEEPSEEEPEEEKPATVEAEQDDADTSQETPDQAEDPEGQGDPGEAKEMVVDEIEPGEITTLFRVRRMYNVAYALDKRGFTDYAKYIALTVAITEFAGGILILLGLFSRLWGFALGGVMLGVLYYKSMGLLPSTGNPMDLALSDNLDQFNLLVRYLSLFVLAIGVMLTGPGPISLDRLLFKREPSDDEDLEND